MVSIKTREPGAEWGGNAGLSFGDHNSQEYRLNASGPISESLGVSISGLYNDRDGFIKNVPTGSEIDSRETTAGRLQFVLKPSDPWTLTFVRFAERYDDGFMPTYNPLSDVGPHKVNRDFPGYVDTDVDTLALTAEFDGSQYDFSSVTAYRSWEQDLQQDFDFTAIPVVMPQIGFFPVIGVSQPDLEQFSQELKLSSEENETFNWALGAYYSDRDTDNVSGSLYPQGMLHPQFGQLPGPIPDYTSASMNDEDKALFWEGDLLALQIGIKITAGLRYQDSDRSINRSSSTASVNASDDWDAWLPKLGVSFALSEQDTLFASATKKAFSLEVSTTTAARRSRLNMTRPSRGTMSLAGPLSGTVVACTPVRQLFYSDFEDYQVYRSNPMNPTEAYMVNASEASSFGLELEAEAAVSDTVTLSAALGLVNAEFDSYTDNVLRSVLGPHAAGYEFGGNDINFVPEYTANLGAHIELPWNLYTNWEVQGIGDYWLDEANTAEQDAYALVNARIGYKRDNWELFVYARNLTDEDYSNNALDLRYTDYSNPAAPRPAGMILHIPGWERTIGAGLSASF